MIIPLRLEVLGGLAVLLLGSAGIAWHEHSQRLVAEGVAAERGRVADSSLKVDTVTRIKAETTLVKSVRTVTNLRTRVDSLRDTLLLHLTDTIRERVYITKQDSLNQACTESVTACAALRLSLTKERDDWRQKFEAKVSVPQKSCVAPSVITLLLGAGAGYIAHR